MTDDNAEKNWLGTQHTSTRLTTPIVVMTVLYIASLGTAYLALDIAWTRREDVMWETTRTLKITATKVFLLFLASLVMNLWCASIGGVAIARRAWFDGTVKSAAQLTLMLIGTALAILTVALLGYITLFAFLEIWRAKSELLIDR